MAQWAVKVIVMVGSCLGCLRSYPARRYVVFSASVIIVTICRGDTEEGGASDGMSQQ